MNEYLLEFINPVYHQGLNVTVRRGIKWYDKAKIGDKVWINQTGNNCPEIDGIIVGLKYEQFLYLRKDELAFEHDPDCKDISGLRKAMIRAYPDFTDDEDVTVLSFWIN
jgi:hypothetical protein